MSDNMQDDEFNKNPNSKFTMLVGLLAVVFAVLLVLSLLDGSNDAPVQEPEAVADVPEDEPDMEASAETPRVDDFIEEEPDLAEEPIIPDTPMHTEEELAIIVEDIMNNEFGNLASIDYIASEKTFRILPTDVDVNHAIGLIPNGLFHDEFQLIVDNLVLLSEENVELLGPGYTFVMVNPFNEDNNLIVVEDGTLIYNVLDDY